MLRYIAFLSILLVIFAACEKEMCELQEVDDPNKVLSLHGKVLNYYSQQGEEEVQISILDQIGGSYILKWDSTIRSNSDGCFSLFYERDIARIEAIFEEEPPKDYSRINQSIRSNDRNYFYLFTQQGEKTPFFRSNYNIGEEVFIYVTPNAKLDFSKVRSLKNHGFRWQFLDNSLADGLPRTFNYSLEFQNNWKVPANSAIFIEIYRQEGIEEIMVHTEILMLEPQTITEIMW